MFRPEYRKRNRAMAQLRKRGMKMKEIARLYGLSVSRVTQITDQELFWQRRFEAGAKQLAMNSLEQLAQMHQRATRKLLSHVPGDLLRKLQ